MTPGASINSRPLHCPQQTSITMKHSLIVRLDRWVRDKFYVTIGNGNEQFPPPVPAAGHHVIDFVLSVEAKCSQLIVT